MTARKGSLLGVEPFPLSLGVEGLALVLCPGFPNPNCLGLVLGPMSVPDDSQISSGIANHKSQFPSGIILTWNLDNSTFCAIFSERFVRKCHLLDLASCSGSSASLLSRGIMLSASW
jgi:hypothetical protein